MIGILCYVSLTLPLAAQQPRDTITADSMATQTQTHVPEDGTDEEFNLFLAVLAFIGVSIMIGTAIALIAICLLVVLAVLALTALGILSVSVGAGMYKKSITTGLKTALWLTLGILGGGCGAALGWLVHLGFSFTVSKLTAIAVGATAGGLGGALSAWAIARLIQIFFQRFRTT